MISFFSEDPVEVEVEFDTAESKAVRRYLLECMVEKICSPLCTDHLKAIVRDSRESIESIESNNWVAKSHTTFAIFDDERGVSLDFFSHFDRNS